MNGKSKPLVSTKSFAKKCKICKYVMGKCLIGKVSIGKVSSQKIVWSGICLLERYPSGKCQSGICPWRSVSQGTVQLGNCPTIYMSN